MSQLLVAGFPEKYKADEVMLNILTQGQANLADLEDALVVTKDEQGKSRVKSYCDILSATRGEKNEFWGVIITTLLEESDSDSLSTIGINR